MPSHFRKLTFALLMGLLSLAVIFAQSNCSALVQDALIAVADNCVGAGRNEACYGYDQVEASFLTTVADDFFSQPSTIAAIADIETIRTAPLNAETGVWGVAVLNLQANLPNTIPGQSVTFVLLGDVEVENAVAPEDAFVPSEGVEVMVNIAAGANVRSGPGTNFNVIGGLQHRQSVLADGLSEDGAWLRVAYRERPAWLSLSVIAENPALSELPTLSADLQTPMQAFYLRTGIGEPECNEAPDDILLVQGPDNIEISLNVNGANINLGSSGALRIIEIDGLFYLEIIVFDGEFEVDGQVITQGYRSILCLGDEGSRGLDGEDNDLVVTCGASEPERFDQSEFGENWCILEDVPSDILNYGLEILCPGETPPPPPNNTGNAGGTSSELAGVDCSGFSILNNNIPATDFILSWSPATGADSYDVAVFDGGGVQTAIHTGITGTSIGLNGGVGFSGSGYIDVRAFQAGNYACYSRLNFSRTPDPNEPVGGYSRFQAQFVSCIWNDGLSFIVSWSGADGGVTITLGSNTYSSPNESGQIGDQFAPAPNGTPLVISSGTQSISLVCNNYQGF